MTDRGRDATHGVLRIYFSVEGMTEGEASAFASELQAALPEAARARVYREDHTFRDYFMDPLYAEGPDGQRFELDHVRASTLVGDVASEIMSAYSDSFWPTDRANRPAFAVVDVRSCTETRRVQSSTTLHDAGVKPRDVLCVSPERRAGAVRATNGHLERRTV